MLTVLTTLTIAWVTATFDLSLTAPGTLASGVKTTTMLITERKVRTATEIRLLGGLLPLSRSECSGLSRIGCSLAGLFLE